jgi:predicted ester cyclase
MSLVNEELVQRWHEEGINQQQPDLALELCTDDFQFHFAFVTPDYPKGAAALRHWLIGTLDFFPDFTIEINDLVSDGEKVAFRANIKATHGGKIFGVEPSGMKLTWSAMGIVRVENGKMAEFWWMPDLFTLMDQLQLVPD